MRSLLVVWFSLAILPILSGCGGAESPSSMATAPATPAIPDTTMEAEVGCAACIYGMEGIKRCTTAAKIGDQAMLVQGGGVDAHEMGLCKAPRNATIVGHVEGDTLVASSITLH